MISPRWNLRNRRACLISIPSRIKDSSTWLITPWRTPGWKHPTSSAELSDVASSHSMTTSLINGLTAAGCRDQRPRVRRRTVSDSCNQPRSRRIPSKISIACIDPSDRWKPCPGIVGIHQRGVAKNKESRKWSLRSTNNSIRHLNFVTDVMPSI